MKHDKGEDIKKGVNSAGKSTAKRMAATRHPTPKKSPKQGTARTGGSRGSGGER